MFIAGKWAVDQPLLGGDTTDEGDVVFLKLALHKKLIEKLCCFFVTSDKQDAAGGAVEAMRKIDGLFEALAQDIREGDAITTDTTMYKQSRRFINGDQVVVFVKDSDIFLWKHGAFLRLYEHLACEWLKKGLVRFSEDRSDAVEKEKREESYEIRVFRYGM